MHGIPGKNTQGSPLAPLGATGVRGAALAEPCWSIKVPDRTSEWQQLPLELTLGMGAKPGGLLRVCVCAVVIVTNALAGPGPYEVGETRVDNACPCHSKDIPVAALDNSIGLRNPGLRTVMRYPQVPARVCNLLALVRVTTLDAEIALKLFKGNSRVLTGLGTDRVGPF